MTNKILDMIKDVEFSNDNSKLLHKNPTEDGLTYFGIYQSKHPNWYGWNIIERYLVNTPDLEQCSRILANVSDLNKFVKEFYKKEFFDKLQLNLVNSEHKQLEIMCFAINVGRTSAIRVLQKLLNIKVDGIVGNQTINALNSIGNDLFDILFDTMEIEYYEDLVKRKDKFIIYLNGWKTRAKKY